MSEWDKLAKWVVERLELIKITAILILVGYISAHGLNQQ